MNVFDESKTPHEWQHIKCDVEGCETISPPWEEINRGPGGLIGLGWYCKGGEHRCPRHATGG